MENNSQNRNNTSSEEDEYTSTQPCDPSSDHFSQREMKEKPWAKLISLNSKYPSIEIIQNELTIGRRKTCTITFEDTKVSGIHCKIYRKFSNKKYEIFLEDLSSNGTYVNGNKVGKGNIVLLTNQNRIDLVSVPESGECVMSYLFEDKINSKKENEIENLEIIKNYDIKSEIILGTGNFSVVKLAIEKKTGEKRAIKIIDKYKYHNSQTGTEQLNREIEILRSVKHENIISVYDVYDSSKYIYLILEFAEGGELFDNIQENGFYTEDKAKFIFRQLLKGVQYLHSKGIVHRDLKPENILLESKESLKIKITDFGLARLIDQQQLMTTMCGTPQYVAPEIVSQSGIFPIQIKGYGKEVDIWSLGAILYIMLSGLPPFDQDNSSMYEHIEQGKFEFPEEFWSEISNDAKDLIKKMLTVDPKIRISIEDSLKHVWCQIPNNSSTSLGDTSPVLKDVKKNLQKNKSQMRGNSLSFPNRKRSIEQVLETTDTELENGENNESRHKKPRRLTFTEEESSSTSTTNRKNQKNI